MDPASAAAAASAAGSSTAANAASASSEAEEGEIDSGEGGADGPGAKHSEDGEAAPAADDPVYATKEEARAAFRALLADKRVTARMKNFATDVQPLICDDVRYRALRTLPERKKVWLGYIEDLVRQEHDARVAREKATLSAFEQLLVETVEIDAKSRYRTSLPLLEHDDRFRALHALYLTERLSAGSTDARANNEAVHQKLEHVFYKHVDALLEKAKLAAAARRLAQAEAFKQLLREHTDLSAMEDGAPEKDASSGAGADEKDEGELEEEEGALPSSSAPRPSVPRWITAETSWRQLRKHALLTADPRWKEGPSEAEAFELYEEWMQRLDKVAREKAQKEKEQRRAQEKALRKDFRALLAELASTARLHARSRWKDVLPLVSSDTRYTTLLSLYQSKEAERGDDAHSAVEAATKAQERLKDLTADFAAELADKQEPLKKTIKSTVLREIHLTVLPTHTPEQLRDHCAAAHPRWNELVAPYTSGDVLAVFADLVAKQALKESYFHSKQKAAQKALVFRMLRQLYPEQAEAAQLTVEQVDAKLSELQQPVPEEAPAAEKKQEEEEPEEGAIEEEEGELREDDPPAAPKLVPRKLPPVVAEGIAAWNLLRCPPIPPPGADPLAPPPKEEQPPYSTEEFVQEALEEFKAKAKAAAAEQPAADGEERKDANNAGARKRRRDSSRSRSPSPAKSKPRREENAAPAASAAPAPAAAAAMDDVEEGELPDE